MNARHEAKFGLSGHFKLIAHGGKRGRVELAEFDNLILDQGLNRFSTATCISYAQVGTSNAAVSASQSSLSGYLAGTNTAGTGDNVHTYVPGPPAYHQSTFVFRFGTGAAAGNLQEVGVGWGSSGATLFSRALIVDNLGNPASVTVLPDESLDVVYTLRVYMPADVTGTVNIGGTDYSYTLRPGNFSNSGIWSPRYLSFGPLVVSNGNPVAYSGTIGAATAAPSGTTAAQNGSVTPVAYVNNSYQRDLLLTLDLTQGNIAGGFQSIYFYGYTNSGTSWAAFQMQFSPLVPKDATKKFTLTYRVAWARRP